MGTRTCGPGRSLLVLLREPHTTLLSPAVLESSLDGPGSDRLEVWLEAVCPGKV